MDKPDHANEINNGYATATGHYELGGPAGLKVSDTNVDLNNNNRPFSENLGGLSASA